jgi:hypothetical protein
MIVEKQYALVYRRLAIEPFVVSQVCCYPCSELSNLLPRGRKQYQLASSHVIE